jgi:hypothetical protein
MMRGFMMRGFMMRGFMMRGFMMRRFLNAGAMACLLATGMAVTLAARTQQGSAVDLLITRASKV